MHRAWWRVYFHSYELQDEEQTCLTVQTCIFLYSVYTESLETDEKVNLEISINHTFWILKCFLQGMPMLKRTLSVFCTNSLWFNVLWGGFWILCSACFNTQSLSCHWFWYSDTCFKSHSLTASLCAFHASSSSGFVNNVFISWTFFRCTALFLGLKLSVCVCVCVCVCEHDIKYEVGSSLSSSWQTESLWKHRCCLSQHSGDWCDDTAFIFELTHAAWDIR